MAAIESASLGLNAQAARLTNLLLRQPLWIVLPAGVVAMAGVILWHSPSEREVLLSGQRFRAEELAAIEAAFARAGLQQYEINDEVVSVPRREKTAYIRALEDADVLPRALSASLQEAIYASHPFESPAQRQARWKFAGEQELASYLRALDDIDDATVRFDEVRHDGLQPSHAIRAMVVLKPTRGTVLVPERLQSVCELVAASRVGMSPSDVTVLDLGSGQTFTSGAAWTAGQRQDQFARRKLTY
jgi:flagellar M-ring protein FliF